MGCRKKFIDNMKIWGLLVFATAALANYDYDERGGDKGPRFCAKANQVKDTGSVKFVCRPRNGKKKHPNLTKRCKVRCGGLTRTGPKKFFCNPKVGWIMRKDPDTPVDPTTITCT